MDMKKFLFGLMAVLMMITVTACKNNDDSEKKDKEDEKKGASFAGSQFNAEKAEAILATVPKNVLGVGMVNLKTLTDKIMADNGAQLRQTISELGAKPEEIQVVMSVLGKNSPLDLSSPAVIFATSPRDFYFSFLVSDPSAFRDFVSQQSKGQVTFSQNGNDWIVNNGMAIMRGNQFWSSAKPLSSRDIDSFTSLSAQESVLYAAPMERLMKANYDFSVYADLVAIGKYENDMDKMLVVSSFVINDLRYAEFFLNFENGMIRCGLTPLDSKGQRAEMSIAPGKIDISALSSAEGRGNVFAAINVDERLKTKIEQLIRMAGERIPAEAQAIIEHIQGNVSFVGDITNPETFGDYPYLTLNVGFDQSDIASEIANMIYLAPTDKDVRASVSGNTLRIFANGGANSGQSFSSVASQFNDAGLGIVADFSGINDQRIKLVSPYISGGSLMWMLGEQYPWLELKLFTRENQNALNTLMQLFSMAYKMDKQNSYYDSYDW